MPAVACSEKKVFPLFSEVVVNLSSQHHFLGVLKAILLRESGAIEEFGKFDKHSPQKVEICWVPN